MKNAYLYIGGIAGAVAVSAILAWFIFASAPKTPVQTTGGTDLGTIDNSSIAVPQGEAGNTTGTTGQIGTTVQQKIFKLSDGPVAGATFVEASRPTTTLARFVMADNGHVFDLSIDTQGAVPKALSNTTIPGALSVQWAGGSALLQYLDGSTPKTVYLNLPTPDASSTLTKLSFFPDGIVSYAIAPKNDAAVYVLRTSSGVTGYISKPDGTGGKKLFSLPLTQIQLRWPAEGEILAYSNASAGVPGIAFAIDAKTGTITPLVYAPGLTATADAAFAHVLYQTNDGSVAHTFSHDVSSGTDKALSLSPLPEQCAPSQNSIIMVCAASLNAVADDYLDLWHQGAANAADSLMLYNLASGTSTLVATPGGNDGGTQSDMAAVAVSPDGRYALYISKEDRSLWGVRLTQ
jgi:hypothetical protein